MVTLLRMVLLSHGNNQLRCKVVCTHQHQTLLGHLKAQDREEQRDHPNFQDLIGDQLHKAAAVKRTRLGEGVGELILQMMIQAEGEGKDVVIITGVTILLSLEVIVTRPTAEKNAGITDLQENMLISVRCQTRLHIIGATVVAEETGGVAPRTDHIIIIIATGTVRATLEATVLHQDIVTVKRSAMRILTRRWCQLWM